MIKSGPIPKLQSISKEQFSNEFLKLSRPVILQDAIRQWPALKLWSLDYFQEAVGRLEVDFKKMGPHIHPHFTDDEQEPFTRGTLSQFTERFKAAQKAAETNFVLRSFNLDFQVGERINEGLKPLLKDFETPSLVSAPVDYLGLWISPKGAKSWIHYDKPFNLNAQIVGRKRVLLFDPAEADKLSALSQLTPPFNFQNSSHFDAFAPDEDEFPLSKDVHYMEAILEPGELLYIPPYWWHCLEHLGDVNINLNFWWQEAQQVHNPLLARDSFLAACQQTMMDMGFEGQEDMIRFLEERPEVAELILRIEANILKAS